MSQSQLAKKVIVEIIRQAGGSLMGTTRIYKAFYVAHLFYAEEEPGYLTDWPIVRMPHGPGIDEGDELLSELVRAGILTVRSVLIGPYKAMEYTLTGKELPGEPLANDAIAAIKKAADFVKGHTAPELSEMTHEFSRSFKETNVGRQMNIYVDAIPDDEYDRRSAELRVLRSEIRRAIGAREAV
jgi:hypothetical protein